MTSFVDDHWNPVVQSSSFASNADADATERGVLCWIFFCWGRNWIGVRDMESEERNIGSGKETAPRLLVLGEVGVGTLLPTPWVGETKSPREMCRCSTEKI